MAELTHATLVAEFIGALVESAKDITQFIQRWTDILSTYRWATWAGCEEPFADMLERMEAGVTVMLVHGWSPAIVQTKLSTPFGVNTTITGLTVVNDNPDAPLTELQHCSSPC